MECLDNLKKLIQMWVFLIGVAILCWQTSSTFETFSSFRTTFAISKETPKNFPTPTIVVCQEPNWNNGVIINEGEEMVDISDEDWISKKFHKLNDKMNISINMEIITKTLVEFNLMVGNNTLQQAITPSGIPPKTVFFEVKEFINPTIGLCYAIVPNQYANLMKMGTLVEIRSKFAQDVNAIPILSVYLISLEDWYGFLLPDFGRLKPFKVSLPGLKTLTWIGTEMERYEKLQRTWDNSYLPTDKTNCKDYTKLNSYTKCLVERIIHCFENNAQRIDSGCRCVPKYAFESYFEVHPISLKWKDCTNNFEYANCSQIIARCQQRLTSKCPSPCKKVKYSQEVIRSNGYQLAKENEIIINLQLTSRDIEVHTERLETDLPTFIGTFGGSLGLFIGFSLTGFVEKVLDFFIRD